MNINLNITKNDSVNRLIKLLSSEKHSIGIIGYGRSLKLEIESGKELTEPLKLIILTDRNIYEEKNFEFEDYAIELQYQPLSFCQHKIVKERNAKWIFILKDCVIFGDEKAADYLEKIEDKSSGVCEYLKTLAKEIYSDGPYPLKKIEIERIRYRLFVESERLKESVKNNPNNAQFLMSEGFHKLIETYFRLERIWAQSTSSPYVLYELKKHNYNLYGYGINFLNEQNIRHKFYYYYKITEEILKPFGGFSEKFKSGKRRGYSKNYSILLHPVYFVIQSIESSILQEDYKYYRLYSLIKLLRFLKPYYFYFIEVTAYGLLAAGLAMIPTYFTKIIFDTVLPAKNYGLLKILLLTGGIAAGFKALLDLLQNYYSAYMQSLIDYDVKFKFYKKIFNLPASYFTNAKTGEVIFKFSDLSAAIGILSNLIIQMLEYVLYFFLFPVIIFIIDYKLALLSAIVIPFNAYCYYKLSDYIRKYVKSITARQEEYSAKSYESISGIRAIQGYNIKDRVLKKLKYLYLNIRKNSMIITAITNGFEFIIAIAAIISGIFFTWYAVSRILIGDLTIGELIMFGMLAGYLLLPIKQLLSLGPEIQRGIIRSQRFFEVYDIKPPIEPSNPVIIEKINKIEFDKVYFEYDADNPVLSGCSFIIDKETITGIAGKSGCGKSTLINLFCKFNLSSAGTIFINDVPIEKISTEQLRKKICSVMQNDILFEGSVKDNFKLINLSVKDAEILKLLEITGFEFEDEESVIDFKIEENGKNISGGQKFRLLLSRALAKKPEILIIDEGFSNIEPEKESFIMRSLRLNFPEMKIILISHRISSLQFCDKILFIENGTISGYSDYNNLIKENGNFKKLLNAEII